LAEANGNESGFKCFYVRELLSKKIAESGLTVQQYHLKDYFEEEFFETKQVIYAGV
jgi:hypothetical protein